MIRIERHIAREAIAVDQQQDFAAWGYGALASGEDDFPPVQDDTRIKVLFGVERLVAGVADEIIGHPKAISIVSCCRVKPHDPKKKRSNQNPKPACSVAMVNHDRNLLLLIVQMAVFGIR